MQPDDDIDSVVGNLQRRPQRREDLLKEALVGASFNLIRLRCAWPGCRGEIKSRSSSCRICGLKFCGSLCIKNHLEEYCLRNVPLSRSAKSRIPKIPSFLTEYTAIDDGSITLIRRFTFLFEVFLRSFGVKSLPVFRPLPYRLRPSLGPPSAYPANSPEVSDPSFSSPDGVADDRQSRKRLRGPPLWYSSLHALFNPLVEHPVLEIMVASLDSHNLWDDFCQADLFKRMSIYYRSLSLFFVQLYYDMCDCVRNEPVTLRALLNPPNLDPKEIVTVSAAHLKKAIEKNRRKDDLKKRVAESVSLPRPLPSLLDRSSSSSSSDPETDANRLSEGEVERSDEVVSEEEEGKGMDEEEEEEEEEVPSSSHSKRIHRHYFESLLTHFRQEVASRVADELMYLNEHVWEKERRRLEAQVVRLRQENHQLRTAAWRNTDEIGALKQLNEFFREEISVLMEDVSRMQDALGVRPLAAPSLRFPTVDEDMNVEELLSRRIGALTSASTDQVNGNETESQ